MVGIAGFALARRDEADAGKIGAMWDSMVGPVGGQADFHLDEHVVCAFDRPNGATQNAVSSDGDVTVWLDGEIYDFGATSERSDPKADAAVSVANHYRSNDLDFFKTVDGVFAAVIYDRVKQQIHFVNDRYGLRQFYIWHPASGGIVWASKVRAFLEAPGFTPRIDRSALSDFIEIGYMMEDRTWFEGVSLLPSASLLTWDIPTRRATHQRYWWWDQIRPLVGPINETEIAEELANRFSDAVQRRVLPNERVGVFLSGGLDSRAILAAMPNYSDPVQVATFGADGCLDRTLATQAAKVRGATSHQFELDEKNWLAPRISGVWLSDGQHDLMHMHGIELGPTIRNYFDIHMNGFGGDGTMGGSYLRRDALDCPITAEGAARFMGCHPSQINIGRQYESLNKLDYYFLHNRVRRFLYGAVALSVPMGLPCRLPFFDNKLIELVYSLPDTLRFGSRIYRKMLLSRYPAYFKSIPWQKTGVPIGYSRTLTQLVHYRKRAQRKLSQLTGGLIANPFSSEQFADYDGWIKIGSARSFLEQLFNNPDSIYPAYLPRDIVRSDWESHLAGQNKSQALLRYATFEIWLQQVFARKMRPHAR